MITDHTPTPKTYARPIIIVQGAQYGSEAKGAITAFLTNARNCSIAIRTGTVNAGHTVYYKGQAYAMQQLPVSWVKPDCKLVIGPGAYIHPAILLREIQLIKTATGRDPRERIYIDYRCGLHLPSHTEKAQDADRHHKMGATGKGCSEAVVQKIRGRGSDAQLFIDWYKMPAPKELQLDWRELDNLMLCDTVKMVNDAYDSGERIIIEGTQGTLLDLHTGPYPYTTHKQTLTGNWLSEAGLSPSLNTEVVSVARTYPIRVAGNSGPLPKEISWAELAGDINSQLKAAGQPEMIKYEAIIEWQGAVARAARELTGSQTGDVDADIEYWNQERREMARMYVSELHATAIKYLSPGAFKELSKLFELTTVTKKLRRVARLDMEQLKYSCMLNRPSSLVITFMNYEYPLCWGKTLADIDNDTLGRIVQHIAHIEYSTGVKVSHFSTGPEESHIIGTAEAIASFQQRVDAFIDRAGEAASA